MAKLYYSAQAAQDYGTHIYSVPNNDGGRREIEITAITTDNYNFSDAQLLYEGDDHKWVRTGTERTKGKEIEESVTIQPPLFGYGT